MYTQVLITMLKISVLRLKCSRIVQCCKVLVFILGYSHTTAHALMPWYSYLLRVHALHLGGRRAWTREELVDEQTRELILAHQLQRLLKILQHNTQHTCTVTIYTINMQMHAL